MLYVPDKYTMWADAFNKGFLQGLQDAYKQKEIFKRASFFDQIVNPQVTETQTIPFSPESQLYGSIPAIQKTTTQGFLEKYMPKEAVNYIKGTFALTGQMPNVAPFLLKPQYQTVNINGNLFKVNNRTGEVTQVYRSQPKVKFVKTLDLGNKIIPMLILDNGEYIITPEFVKGLSPDQRARLNQLRKELDLKVKRFELDKEKFANDKAWREYQKRYNQQRLGIEKEKLNTQKQKQSKDDRLKYIKAVIRGIQRRYNIAPDPFMGSEEALDVISEIAKVNQRDAERLRQAYEALWKLTESKIKDLVPPQPEQPQPPQWLKSWLE